MLPHKLCHQGAVSGNDSGRTYQSLLFLTLSCAEVRKQCSPGVAALRHRPVVAGLEGGEGSNNGEGVLRS